MNTAAQWFILRADKEEGPYTAADLRRLIADRAIDWNTLAYTEGLPDWVKLRDTQIHSAWRSDTWCFAIGGAMILSILAWGCFFIPSSARDAVFALAALLYLIPSFIALRNRHHNLAAIVALNILLGWTFIGWAVALVWALTKPAKLTS